MRVRDRDFAQGHQGQGFLMLLCVYSTKFHTHVAIRTGCFRFEKQIYHRSCASGIVRKGNVINRTLKLEFFLCICRLEEQWIPSPLVIPSRETFCYENSRLTHGIRPARSGWGCSGCTGECPESCERLWSTTRTSGTQKRELYIQTHTQAHKSESYTYKHTHRHTKVWVIHTNTHTDTYTQKQNCSIHTDSLTNMQQYMI